MTALSDMSDDVAKTDGRPVALVTGASGFVGGHLARRLVRDGWNVHILTRPESRLQGAPEFSRAAVHVHDGSTEGMTSCVGAAKPDVVFHLASLFLSQHLGKDVTPLIESNVLFGTQLLDAMRASNVTRIINTGTSWQHYDDADYNPVCLYAATKEAFEAILEYYVQAEGFQAITLKLFDTYGPGDTRPKLFNLLRKASSTGEALDMSAGEQLIDLVYIDDVIDAYVVAAQRLLGDALARHERYAVSSGRPLPLKNLVETYAKVANRPVNVNWGARPYRAREVMVPWSNGQLIGGWRPRVSLAEGLARLNASSTGEGP